MFGVRRGVSEAHSDGAARIRRRRLVVGVLLVEALVLGLGVPAGELPGRGGFPISGLLDWLRPTPDRSAAFAGLPKQASGGRPDTGNHAVPADATRADGGAGRPAGKGIGALPADTRPAKKTTPVTTPAITGAHSFNPATSRKVEAASTATSDVYRNTDGTFTRKVFPAPVNFRAAGGAWKPIDTTLDSGAGGRLHDRANALDLEFAPRAADPTLATLKTSTGNILSYRLEGATDVAGTVDRSTVTYPRVLADTDLVLQSMRNGLKESIVLHSAKTATSWVFPLTLGALTARLTADGAVDITDAAGKSVARIPHGY